MANSKSIYPDGYTPLPGEPGWLVLRRRGYDADRLLSYFQVAQPPVPVFEMLEALDVSVHLVRTNKYAGGCQSTESKADVWINEGDAFVRQRFTAAHELGHLMLHPMGTLFRDLYPPPGTPVRWSRDEREANAFAARLLMPASMLLPAAERMGLDYKRLARAFQVSEDALRRRLQELYPQ